MRSPLRKHKTREAHQAKYARRPRKAADRQSGTTITTADSGAALGRHTSIKGGAAGDGEERRVGAAGTQRSD